MTSVLCARRWQVLGLLRCVWCGALEGSKGPALLFAICSPYPNQAIHGELIREVWTFLSPYVRVTQLDEPGNKQVRQLALQYEEGFVYLWIVPGKVGTHVAKGLLAEAEPHHQSRDAPLA